jgi:hypothetical protein
MAQKNVSKSKKEKYRFCGDAEIKEAVGDMIRNKFVGIVSFGPWVSPHNAVHNCIALCIDGGIQYKFSLTYDCKLLVAEIRSSYWIKLPVKTGDVLTYPELEKMIRTDAEYYDAFVKAKRLEPISMLEQLAPPITHVEVHAKTRSK